MVPPPSVAEIEKRLNALLQAERNGVRSVGPAVRIDKEEYKKIVDKIDYWRYIQSADQHYFVSRVLFFRHILEYSLFAGHQCIENYLKGYLKLRSHLPPDTHDLQKLLDLCRKAARLSDAFMHEDGIGFIVGNYDPFFEYARYPVQHNRPKGGFGCVWPDDFYLLDYFVYRMRQLIPVSGKSWNLMREGLMSLQQTKDQFPDFYSLLHVNNINFL